MKQTFKSWSRNKNEFVNYSGYRDTEGNKAIIFDSAASLIECCQKNFKRLGGDGNWTSNYMTWDALKEDSWKFGYDYPNRKTTDEALISGSMMAKYLNRIENVKDQLYKDIPRLKQLSDIAVTKRRRRTYSEDGAELDIDRYMCGDPAMWASMPRVEVRSKTAKIYINTNVMANVSASTITENVIKMAAICDIIIKTGIPVEIYAGTSAIGVHKTSRWCLIACKAKASHEPMDISRLLTFALPGFFRQYMFAIRENTADSSERVDPGLGRSPMDIEELNACCEALEADIKMNGATFTNKETIDLLVGQIEKFFKLDSNETSNRSSQAW